VKKILLILLFAPQLAYTQNGATITGNVTDAQTHELLIGATVSVKGTHVSTSTNAQGKFVLQNLNAGTIVITISHVGYQSAEIVVQTHPTKTAVINVALHVDERIGSAVVISASKRREKITNAPASIQVLGAKELSQFAGSNITQLFSRVQGIEFTRSGVDDITINARGLNSAFNNKVLQMVDGRNTMAPLSAGIALFNNGTTIKDDIEQIEIVLGPQSALYGPNAHNALINYITKDPRKYQGTTISTSAGSQSQFSTRVWHALKVSDKWAYKLTGEYAVGKDYEWYDSVYAGSPNGFPFGPAVAIPERIKDFDFERYRGEAHVYYSLTPASDIILSAGGSHFTRLQVTTSGRNQMKDVTYGFLQARYVQRGFYANIYESWGNLGNTLLLTGYTRDFWNRTHDQVPGRRLSADSAEAYASRLGNTVKEKSRRLNAEVQFNHDFRETGLSVVTGLTYQLETPDGYGITLTDSFQKISITQFGAVAQLDKALPHGFRLIATTRFDHHSNFGGFISPRFALLKGVGNGTFRITWGRAYAMPSIQNQYAGINSFLFGNGAGINYIPNGSNVYNAETYAVTVSLRPEQVSTWEVGYKGNIDKRLYVDVNYYNGRSKNFISPARSVGGRVIAVNGTKVMHNPVFAGRVVDDTLSGASFLTFFNYGEVKAFGVDADLRYNFNKFISLAVKYSWFGSDITNDNTKNDANTDGYVSAEEKSLNAPVNRAVGILQFQNLLKEKFFLNLSARYVEQYDFYSGSQIGTAAGKGKRGIIEIPGKPPLIKNFDWGPLGGFTTIDVEAGYKFNEMVTVNAGVSNLLNTHQIEMVGSPSVSRIIMVELKVQVPDMKSR
jgi:iron complex outermembrane receptor protein